MNRIYKVIWSKVKHQYVVVSELAHRDGKRSKSIVCSTAALLAVFALTAGVGVAPVWAVNTADATTELIDSNYSAYLDKENTITNSEDTYVVGNGNIIDNFVEGMVIGNGNELSSNGSDNLIIGNDNAGSGQVLNNSIVLGSHNVWEAAASDNIFIGNNINLNTTRSNGSNTVVVGHDVTADPMVSALGDEITASWGASVMGYKASSEDNSVSIGHLANADAAQTVAIGYGAKSRSGYGAAIGAFAEVGSNSYGLALGGYSRVGNSAMKSIAIGTSGRGYTEGRTEVKDGASYSIAMGGKTTVGENAEQSVAIGGYQAIVGDNAKYSTAIGTFSDIAANVEHGTAVGYNTNVDANYGTALGNGASANGEWSTALGASTDAKQQATAVGSNAQALAGNSVAVGVNSSVAEGADYSVALGTSSKVEEGDAFTTTDLEDFKKKLGDTYNTAWNITSADGTLGVVSVGAKGKERRLVNVARGRIDADSTDAVNGSQLYGLASDLNEKIENAGGDWVLTTNGGTSPGEQTTIGKGNTVDFTGAKDAETEHQNIQVSQAQVKDGKGNVIGTDVSLDLNDRVELGTGADQVVIDATTGQGSIAVGDKVLMSATGAANFGNIELNSEGQGNPQHVSTITGLTNTEWNQTGTYNAGRAATEEQLQDAIGEVNKNAYKGWNLKVGDVSTPVNSNDTVLFQTDTNDKGASNLYITKDGLNVTVGMEDNITLTGVTADRVSVGTVSINAATGIDAGGHKITNVHDGEISASSQEAVNGSQLYQIKEQHTTVSDGKNIHVDETTGDKGQKDYKVSLEDDVYLGEAGTGIALEGRKGMATIGDAISLNGTNGQASFGAVKINGETGNTITGLTNTTWDQNGVYTDGRAATEEQLQDAIGEVNENAYKGWNVTANGNVEGSKTISSGNTVDFAGQTDENGHSNVVVSKEDTKDGTNLKFDLNDKVVLGDDKDSQIVLDGTTGNVSIGNVSVDNGTGISFMADGSATFGKIQINKENGSTIIGLTNTTWEPNGTYNAGRAATEEQLKAVSDKVGEVSVEAGKHTTVSVGKNMTVDETDADGQKDYKVMLNDDLYLGDVNQGSGAYVNVFGSTAQIMLGKGSAAPIVIDGGTGTISGLSNLEWNYNSYLAGTYDGSTLAATESQLHDAFGYLDDKINNISITGDDNINVSKPADGEGGTETPGTGSTSPSFDITMSDNPQFGGHADDGQGHAANGSVTVVGTGTDGTAHKVVVDGATGTVSGLSNTEWDWNKYGKPAEEGGYAGSTNAATESQLQGALEGTVQYDRDENGNVDKTNVTLNKGGDSVTIHNVAAGTADTDAVNVSQLNQAWDQINNNTTAITNIGNKVGELDSRIDEVGAGAAALAALHPLDFDPDDKWDFSAGYGNYRGENAVAIGAFYRPNEDTMFSVGGTVGNGDNMVNAGVSFKIGQGNNVSTSRVAMAKEIKSMRDIVAKQDAQIQKLTAMVNALVGMEAIAPDTTTMFPDVPENHWAYEAVEMMAKTGLVQGYPDGEFKGDRTMTRYEFAQIVYNAIQAGIKVDERLVQEFRPELEYFRIDTISKDKDGNPVIQRVRANEIPATK